MNLYRDPKYLKEAVDEAMELLKTNTMDIVMLTMLDRHYLNKFEYRTLLNAIWDERLRRSRS